MKALHLCQRDDAATGGATRVAVELVRRLPDHGVDALCAFVYGPPGVFQAELGGRTRYLELPSSRSLAACCLRLWQLLNSEKPDVIHHHDGLTWTHLVTAFWRGKGLIIGHGHLTAPVVTAPWRYRLAGWIQRLAYHRLICVSQSVARSWSNRGFAHSQIEVIPNGVDTETFVPASRRERERQRQHFRIPAEAFTVSYVGRLHNEVKCCDDFVRMMAALPDTAWGIVAGSGPDEEVLKGLAQSLGVGRRLCFAGLMTSTLGCYQASDVFMLTSSYEPFGLVVLEAAACGVPVVGFQAEGGVSELLAFVDAKIPTSREPAAMTAAVTQAFQSRLADPAKAETIRSRVKDRYDWSSIALAVANFYRKAQSEVRLVGISISAMPET